MIQYIKHHPWKIIEEGFHPEYNRISESVFSIGNGKMGQRGNFEEGYSGETLQGSYIAGIYYPDKTKVGWWKNGYPEYFAKVLNSVNWIGLRILVNGELLDLATIEIQDFLRELDMKEGILRRTMQVKMPDGTVLSIESERFYSMDQDEIAAMQFHITALSGPADIELTSFLDFDIENEDSNYDEKFWNEISQDASKSGLKVEAETKKLFFRVHAAAHNFISVDGIPTADTEYKVAEKYAEETSRLHLANGSKLTLTKYVSITSSFYHEKSELSQVAQNHLDFAVSSKYENLKEAHVAAWEYKWQGEDIEIMGDDAAQQGIRFNIFQLNQTYTGSDSRLNIGPKGFTGEKYGGSTYWDTEAYCIPFYLSTADQSVARNLLLYRYRHLPKAIENAEKLGFSGGAALYPMVTMNGEECHNEWEITFEEIHRNGAIAYAIFDYVRYTGDQAYVYEYGAEVLLAISRFWAQRFNYSEEKRAYVMLGVTGPNEYENNVHNNWYTNYIAAWCLRYTGQSLDRFNREKPELFSEFVSKTSLEISEIKKWKEIIDNCYYPRDEKRRIFLQQDGFLDKVYKPVDELSDEHKPINKNWSWDRILRSCYIKQADVLQGMYFFEDEFDVETIRRHFDYYEPITVHESSLSPCVHVILASVIGYREKAYEMYLRTARLDLDDYNADSDEGCHTTSMAGTWMAVVKGFGGMRVQNDVLCFDPYIPSGWEKYRFKIRFRGATIRVSVTDDKVQVENLSDQLINIRIKSKAYSLKGHSSLESVNSQENPVA